MLLKRSEGRRSKEKFENFTKSHNIVLYKNKNHFILKKKNFVCVSYFFI
jgi:hypothetical protein